MKKITAIIQARMGSTRLPNKSLMKIGNKTLLERVIDRILLSRKLEQYILATTDLPIDNQLVDFVQKRYPQIKIFRGENVNVLARFKKAAEKFQADPIVRITADDPFKDPSIIDQLITLFTQNHIDYVSNTIEHTYPEGLDVEVFSFSTLNRGYREGKSKKDKEHVTFYIWNHPKLFKLKNIMSIKDNSDVRLTVDYMEDMKLAQEIYKHFYPRIDFDYEEIIQLFTQKPELSKINQHIKSYEVLNN